VFSLKKLWTYSFCPERILLVDVMSSKSAMNHGSWLCARFVQYFKFLLSYYWHQTSKANVIWLNSPIPGSLHNHDWIGLDSDCIHEPHFFPNRVSELSSYSHKKVPVASALMHLVSQTNCTIISSSESMSSALNKDSLALSRDSLASNKDSIALFSAFAHGAWSLAELLWVGIILSVK